MDDSGAIWEFLGSVSRLLPQGHVLDGTAAQARYGDNTIGIHRFIPGAVSPVSRDHVVDIVKLSRRLEVPLYPVSTGRNSGYGDANPVTDGCIVVDLSSMRRIIELDETAGLVTVEPGVTQGMLRAYLDERDLKFLCPVTGAGPDCSLIGNALERGFGITPYADHFLSMMSLEAVLPDGRLYVPPLAELGCRAADRAFKWGVGPFLDGIFSQGAFGIVTQMTIALARTPERVEAFFFGLKQDTDLENGVESVQATLRDVGGVLGSVNLMNMHRVLAMMEPYPRDHLAADGLIEPGHLAQMARRNQVMPWMGTGAIYGNARVVRAAKSVIRDRLSGVASRLMFFTQESIGRYEKLSELIPGSKGRNLRRIVGTLGKTLQLLAGAPSEIALPLAYWISGRMPDQGQRMNPSRDGCGLMWYSPLVPMQADTVRSYTRMVHAVCAQHRFEPLITLTSLSDRCFDSTVPLLFDRAIETDVDRARRCYADLLEAGRRIGCVPYRSSIDAMHYFIRSDAPFWQIVDALKDQLDPKGLMAPGRYARVRAR